MLMRVFVGKRFEDLPGSGYVKTTQVSSASPGLSATQSAYRGFRATIWNSNSQCPQSCEEPCRVSSSMWTTGLCQLPGRSSRRAKLNGCFCSWHSVTCQPKAKEPLFGPWHLVVGVSKSHVVQSLDAFPPWRGTSRTCWPGEKDQHETVQR